MERRKGKSIKNKCLYAVDRSLTERYQRSAIPNVWRKNKEQLNGTRTTDKYDRNQWTVIRMVLLICKIYFV